MELFIEKSKTKFNNIFCYENLNYISTKKLITPIKEKNETINLKSPYLRLLL